MHVAPPRTLWTLPSSDTPQNTETCRPSSIAARGGRGPGDHSSGERARGLDPGEGLPDHYGHRANPAREESTPPGRAETRSREEGIADRVNE